MADNVITLPRPRLVRSGPVPLAFFIRVGWNDHLELLDLLATGEQGVFGLVIEAHNVDRHRELITESRKRGFDVLLDPKTQQMGLVGGHTSRLGELPWGLDRLHITADFDGTEGRTRAQQIVDFASANNFTQILGPTHLLSGPNDPWLRRDIQMTQWVSDQISASGSNIELVYSLAVPISTLRNPAERSALIAALADAPCNSIWLKIDNFGDDATGEKTAAYIEACRDFHNLGLPVVGDYIGGLPGLGALAFGAVGGIAHGVTMQQNFKAAGLKRPRVPSKGAAARRVYVPQLDMLLKADVATSFLGMSPRVRSAYGCKDTHCCPRGVADMIEHPARHALYQQTREIEVLSETPSTMRINHYLDHHVRRVSDSVAAAAALSNLEASLRKSLTKKQGDMSRFRQAMSHLAEDAPATSTALAPPRRTSRDRGDE